MCCWLLHVKLYKTSRVSQQLKVLIEAQALKQTDRTEKAQTVRLRTRTRTLQHAQLVALVTVTVRSKRNVKTSNTYS